MKYMNMKRWANAAIMIVALLCASTTSAAVPPNWKETGFSINANGMKLRDVLNEFGQAYGVRIVSSIKDYGTLKGRLKAESGTEFMDRLARAYDFRWFVYSGTLYLVPSNENVAMRLEIGEDAVQDAKAALVGVGLFDNRFGWGELPDEGVVLINGPREYVNLARGILMPETKKQTYKGKQAMVFRLKYASATDRVITTRGEKEIVPGIKTILSSLLNQSEPEKSSDGRSEFDAKSEKRSRSGKYGKGVAREIAGNSRLAGARSENNGEDEDSNGHSSKPKMPARDDRPRIDADASLNAIIIYDYASKRDMYQSLIAELDTEPHQIEIEALIVDIDRTKLADLGVEWGVRKGDTVTRVNGTRSDSKGTELPIPGSTMLISNAARFYARLKAMEDNGEARVLAKPTVLTLENVAAVLDLSQTAYVPLVGERVADLANITAGTMLRVVPRVLREGVNTRVRLEVDIEDGALGDPNLKSSVTRSTISTQAIIDMQQTLMIGGYHSESNSKDIQKVPVLGDVPLFGGLFRSTTETHNDRERLFLITPRLADSGGVAAPPRSKAGSRAREIAQEEMEKMMEGQQKNAPASSTPLNMVSTPSAPANIPADTSAEQKVSAEIAKTSEQPSSAAPRRLRCVKPKLGFGLTGLSRLP